MATLKERAEQIRDEVAPGANTATRVGEVLVDLEAAQVAVEEKITSVGRLDIDHSVIAFVAEDINTYMEADDTGGAVTLNIPDGLGSVGDQMVVRKIGAVNDLTITATGTDSLIGDSKVTTQYHIIHLYKVTATRWNTTGGVS